MQGVLVLCATLVIFSTARGADIREQVRIDNAFTLEIGATSRSAAFSPDGKILVTATTGGRSGLFGGGRTIFWDPATGKQLAILGDDPGAGALKDTGGPNGRPLADSHNLGALAFSPDGRTLAGACTGIECDICLWDVQTRTLTGRLKGSQHVRSMTFSADGTMLATEWNIWGDVQIWGVKAEKVIATLKAKAQGVQALAFSGDGNSLAVGYGDGTIRVWDVKTGRETARLFGRTQRASVLAFEPGDRTVLSAGSDGAVCRWDLTTRKVTATTGLKGADRPSGLAFGPDLATLAAVDERGLSVWDTRTGARVSHLKAKVRPRVLAFSPGGKWLAADSSEDLAKPSWIQVWAVDKPADK